MAKGGAAPGVYSATYSGIPVWEYQFGTDLKEHVMRRRHDDWINATHILKAAGLDKPARTRFLEREVQKDVHEKIQGGYGKYQGTWIPLPQGEALAQRRGVYDRLRPIFEFQPGPESPPPAPRHSSKPKAPRAKPAIPKWKHNNKPANSAAWKANNTTTTTTATTTFSPAPTGSSFHQDDLDNGDVHTIQDDDETPDNLTVASASFVAEDDPYDLSHIHPSQQPPPPSQSSTTSRKRKRERDDFFLHQQHLRETTEQQHAVYGDELLDYFLLSRNDQHALRPEPPINFQPDWIIDTEQHTALHWASAMGDVQVVMQLKRFKANMASQNVRGETPIMRAVQFTNCYDRETFPAILKELFATVDARDFASRTLLHHATVKSGRVSGHACSRYYLDVILNKLQETHDAHYVQALVDAQDHDGNTAVHLAAMRDARKCIRALLGRGASTDIPNKDGVRAEDLIKELNTKAHHHSQANNNSSSSAPAVALAAPPIAPPALLPHHRSSSPFAAPEVRNPGIFMGAVAPDPLTLLPDLTPPYQSEAANTVHSRVAPLALQKFHDLAMGYEKELRAKDDAEKEARRLLQTTQNELAHVHSLIADIEAQLEEPNGAGGTDQLGLETEAARCRVLELVREQRRLLVDDAVQHALDHPGGTAGLENHMADGVAESASNSHLSNGLEPQLDGAAPQQQSHSDRNDKVTTENALPTSNTATHTTTTTNPSTTTTTNHTSPPPLDPTSTDVSSSSSFTTTPLPSHKLPHPQQAQSKEHNQLLRLAQDLHLALRHLAQEEEAYVDALALVGTGDRIDKYRRLLMACLGPDDADMLDENLDDMIMIMEEDAQSVGGGLEVAANT